MALMLINGTTLVVANLSVKNIISACCQSDRELWVVPAIFVRLPDRWQVLVR